jgi:hypothetical protein
MCCNVCFGIFETLLLVLAFAGGAWALAFREFWVGPGTIAKGLETRFAGIICMLPLPVAVILVGGAWLLGNSNGSEAATATAVMLAQLGAGGILFVCLFVAWLVALLGYNQRRKQRLKRMYFE